MPENTYEYEFVSNLFTSTLNGVIDNSFFGGVRGKKIKPYYGGMLGAGIGNA